MFNNIAAYPQSHFPMRRMRRNRNNANIRNLLQQHHLRAHDFIYPLFICNGQSSDIATLPRQRRLNIDDALRAAERAVALDIPALALFPQTPSELKNAHGSEAINDNNLVCQAVRAIKQHFPDLMLWCDVALDPYTDHGHDGLLRGNEILNDETIDILCQQACVLADAGCDSVAPSDMMDGRIGPIRQALDNAHHQSTRIVAYSAKYASAFYGPFRDAVGSSGALRGDKKTYQMNPANSDEALHEIALDLQEGADLVMVKPSMAYMDIIYRIKQTFACPTVAYQVSGEYAMLINAAENASDEHILMYEALLGLKRAGADAIISYYACDICEYLKG